MNRKAAYERACHKMDSLVGKYGAQSLSKIDSDAHNNWLRTYYLRQYCRARAAGYSGKTQLAIFHEVRSVRYCPVCWRPSCSRQHGAR